VAASDLAPDRPSKARVDRAGDHLRSWVKGAEPEDLEAPENVAAVAALTAWRRAHFGPLLAVQLQAGELAQAIDPTTVPTGRQKRAAAIVRKLIRFPHMRLSQMEDIGGCRIVLPTQAEADALTRAITAVRPEASVDDYVKGPPGPKPDGYRAKHIVVLEQGLKIEIQVRTLNQNRWADEVEDAADRLGFALKDGRGPDDLVEYFATAAAILAAEDEGTLPDAHLTTHLADLREKVRPFFQRGPRTGE
jgi:putative GTP pyrophosphokinase